MTLWPDALAVDVATPADGPAVLGRIGPPTPISAADWHERGIEQELAGDLDSAVRSYTRALAVGGPDAQTAFDLAFALSQAGDTARAIARYREVVQLDPLRADAWINLGDLLADADDTDAAIECFRHAIELQPGDAVAYYNLATVLDDAGEVDRATLYWAMFVELAPDLPQHLAYARTRLVASPGTPGEG